MLQMEKSHVELFGGKQSNKGWDLHQFIVRTSSGCVFRRKETEPQSSKIIKLEAVAWKEATRGLISSIKKYFLYKPRNFPKGFFWADLKGGRDWSRKGGWGVAVKVLHRESYLWITFEEGVCLSVTSPQVKMLYFSDCVASIHKAHIPGRN